MLFVLLLEALLTFYLFFLCVDLCCRGLSLSAAVDQLSFVCISPFGCLFVLHVAFHHVMSAAIFFSFTILDF